MASLLLLDSTELILFHRHHYMIVIVYEQMDGKKIHDIIQPKSHHLLI